MRTVADVYLLQPNSRMWCGSVIVNFVMYFNESVATSTVLTSLKNAAEQNKFGVFRVDPASIKQVSSPTVPGPEECNCSCNDVLLKAIIGVLVFVVLLLIIYIFWQSRKGVVGRQRTYEDERSVYDNEMELKDLQSSLPDSGNLTQPPAEYMDLREAGRDNRKAPSAATANAAESDKRDLMKELETMKQLKPHPHVIKLLGCVTESEPLLVLIEYVPLGDLLGYLGKCRGLNDIFYKDPENKPQTNLA